MSRVTPQAAFVEEYDEDAHVALEDTRQVAYVTPRRSKSELRKSSREPFVEARSDSGYSSRTNATANSTQSAPSGRRSPAPLKVDTSLRRNDLERVRSRTKDRPRDRSSRPPREDKMHAAYSAAYPPSHGRPHRLERPYTREYPSNYWEAEQGVYRTSTPVEPRQREYQYHSSQSSVYDYPPSSPPTPQYRPAPVVQVNSSRPSGRSARSNSLHTANRPVSFHGVIPGMDGVMYSHGPPPSSSAYANAPAYPPTQPSRYPPSSYYGYPDATSTPEPSERSFSQTREQPRIRRASIFERPAIDYESSEEEDSEVEDESVLDDEEPTPPPARHVRARRPSRSYHDRGEDDYYQSMPPPPLKHKPQPRIIQQKRPEMPRKSVTTGSVVSEPHHSSRSLDLTDLQHVLPEYGYRRSARENVVPERNKSLRERRRRSGARVAVERSTRRRRPSVYSGRTESDYSEEDELEEKQRDAELYQASQSSKAGIAPVALTKDNLMTKAVSQRAPSDSGSQKTRSASSRGSDARTQSASGALTTTRPPEEDNNIVMMMNGVTMSFTQESVGGKLISVRTGQTGAVELEIGGEKRPKKYLTNGSEITTASNTSKKGDRRSERASHRSSRSAYNGRY
ncbi:hypothetical protein BJX61DRAFT_531171 [Aspergillus egyptiacus]|nr:hypothetical protein BJX61DRAFT_531171 [Aspergillus egyptiacus]